LRTADYEPEDRERLGRAVTEAREKMGYRSRPQFAKRVDVSLRSLAAVEKGEATVGGAVLVAIARGIPGWDDDTPRAILDGEPSPAVTPSAIKSRTEPEVGSAEWIALQAARLPEEAFLALMIRMAELRRQERTEGRLSDLGVRRTDPNPSETAS